MTVFPRTWAEVDLSAIRHNLSQIRSILPPETKIALVVKADAYGHGLIPVSRAALRSGADWVCVATVQEGVALREAEIDSPILVLAPALEMEAPQVVFYQLRCLIESLDVARAISNAAIEQNKTAKVHIKIDTGMSRFGVQPEDAKDFALAVASLPAIEIEALASHFAFGGGPREYTAWQFDRFMSAVCEIEEAGIHPKLKHMANSAALIKFPEAHLNLVRIGILAYGISHIGKTQLDLRPALTWKARIMAMRDLPIGRKIGYNCTYETDRPSRIATLGVGYGDGYHRALSNIGNVVIHGMRAPVRGLVCMDQIMVDVTDIPDAKVGDAATLLGAEVPADEIASLVGTTPHEIPTRIMSRVPRTYIN